MKKRSFSIKLLLSGMIFSLALSFGILNVNAKASEGTTTTTDQTVETFEMAEGAYVRVSSNEEKDYADVTGIRFTMYFNQAKYTDLVNEDGTLNAAYEIGMCIAIADENTTNVTAETARWTYIAEQLVSLKAAEAKTDVDVYAFRAVLANIPQTEYNTKLIANGYVKQGETTTYATNPQTRTIAQVASKALLSDTVTDPNGDLTNYVDEVVTADNFKMSETLTTDKYKSGTLNEKLGAAFPENLAVKWTNSNPDVVAINEETNELTYGETYGEATLTATLGSTTLTTTITYNEFDPKIFAATEDTAKNITASGVVITYAENSTISGITSNGYDGNAVTAPMTAAKAYNLAISSYTEAELTAISADYNYVSMWMAYNITDNGTAGGAQPWYNSLFYNADNYVAPLVKENADNGVWVKYMIPMEKYIAYAKDKTSVRLIQYDYVVTGTFYFGDVFFEYIEPDPIEPDPIFTATEDTAANIVRGGTTGTYVAAGADEIKDFTDDYTGSAIAIAVTAGQAVYAKISYTADEITSIATKYGYTQVGLWMAYNSTSAIYSSSGTLHRKAGGKYASLVAEGSNTWVKYTVSVVDFVSFISTSGVKLIAFDSSVGTVYFGDIIFE